MHIHQLSFSSLSYWEKVCSSSEGISFTHVFTDIEANTHLEIKETQHSARMLMENPPYFGN